MKLPVTDHIRIPCQLLTFVLAGWLVLAPVAYGLERNLQGTLLTGTVTKIFDGDSLVVRATTGDVEVRLADIDAPEKGQPYSDNARKALIGLLNARDVRVEILDVDQYQRRVARVHRASDGLDINAELVRRGHAWVYRRYLRDLRLIDLERSARSRKAGLWALPEQQRIPPWRYRSLERQREKSESR